MSPSLRRLTGCLLFVALLVCLGCRSPYYADQGALFGGLTGAGVGALVGDASGNAGAGAAIGAGVGALTGAVVGSGLDEVEARNRAMIQAQLGAQVPSGAVTFDDVISMTEAGVDEDLIVNHVRANGAAMPPQANDLILLQRAKVSKRVIEALQTSQPPPPMVYQEVPPPPPPVIYEEFHYGYGPPRWHHGHHHHHRHWGRPRPHTGFGVSISHHD